MQSAIKQRADSIETEVKKKVGTDEIISSINQSAEAVKIRAGKISLEGLVTVNEYFKVNSDGSITAVNGDFSGTIRSESIYSNDFSIHPRNRNGTGKLSLYGYWGSSEYEMFRASYAGGGTYVPTIVLENPCGGDVSITTEGTVSIGPQVSFYMADVDLRYADVDFTGANVTGLSVKVTESSIPGSFTKTMSFANLNFRLKNNGYYNMTDCDWVYMNGYWVLTHQP